jgi:hypothetical protein
MWMLAPCVCQLALASSACRDEGSGCPEEGSACTDEEYAELQMELWRD